MARKKAVILLSGGIDSTTAAAIARNQFDLHALTFRYGQRHEREIEAAKKVAAWLRVEEHLIIESGLRAIGGSALTDRMEIPKGRSPSEIEHGIPVTYVPARNTIFLSLALGWAEVLGAFDIFIGATAVDFSGYPDCRPEYLRAFEHLANLATAAGTEGRGRFRIHAPLLHLSKAEIIRTGEELGVDFSLTHSCYDPAPDGTPCGRCDACRLRERGLGFRA